jgi:hypothetical protein
MCAAQILAPITALALTAAAAAPGPLARAAEFKVAVNQPDAGTIPRVRLPSGFVLTQAAVDLPPRWQDDFFPPSVSVYVGLYPNDAVRGVFTIRQRKLDGPSATLYEDGSLATVAQYSTGLLHGALRLWEENKQRLLYAEYTKGEKHGVTCLFKKGKPWLVQEWTKGELRQQYLVKFLDQTPLVVPQVHLAGQQTQDFAEAVKRLDQLGAEILKGQEDLLAWLKTEDDRLRKDKVAQLGARRGAAARGLTRRQWENAATFESSWRAALAGCGF